MTRSRSTRKTLLRIGSNALSLLASDVVTRATTFVLLAMVPRYLDTQAFGQMSLALVLSGSFQMLAVLGLPTLITRDVARNEQDADLYFVNGSLLAVIGSLLTIAAMGVLVLAMNYPLDTSRAIMLLALANLPSSLSAINRAMLRGFEQMQFIAYANVPVSVAKVACSYYLLERGGGVFELLLVLVGCRLVTTLLEWILIFWFVHRPRLVIDVRCCREMALTTITFLGIDGLLAVWSSLLVLLLSKLAGEKEVGLYSAANQLLLPVILIYQSLTFSLFPILCRKFLGEQDTSSRLRVSRQLVELLLIISVPGALGLFCLADSALVFVYGNPEFAQAAGVLRVLAFTLITRALTTGFGHILFAGHKEMTTLRMVAVDVVVCFVFGMVFISQFGLLGAGLASLLTRLVDVALHYMQVSALVSRINLGGLAWKSILSGLTMAVGLGMLPYDQVLVNIFLGVVIYLTVLAGLFIWTQGGIHQLKTRYL